jgi:hypothetical protein
VCALASGLLTYVRWLHSTASSRQVAKNCVWFVKSHSMGNKKTIHCGVCDLRFHCSCVQISDNDQVFFNSTGKSAFKCVACTKLLRSTRNNDTPVKLQHSFSASEATKKVISPERQLNLPELEVMSHSVFRLKQ